mmetsp:Transcript_645/g.1691  ORF Transcript_645/g.1691 Transcript_645/m.1691 type:complete len:142 (-) Transcript_645:1626-2051(-)
MAALVTSSASAEPERTEDDSHVAEQPKDAEEPSLEQQKSFATTLYKTMNKRMESVRDVGHLLSVSRVLGDGRCLFRSLAKGRAYSSGAIAVWNESRERAEADQLRARAVQELRAHRDLLLGFCVVEGDFNRYCKRMSHPRT